MRLRYKDCPKKTTNPSDGILFADANTARGAMLEHLGVACEACGWTPPKPGPAIWFPTCLIHLHHITPRRQGGPDAWGNLVLLCPTCHAIADGAQVQWSGGHRTPFFRLMGLILRYPVSWPEKLMAEKAKAEGQASATSSENVADTVKVVGGPDVV